MWKGIDVSDNQGVIDWKQVKGANVDFAILRSVRRSGKADNQFTANLAGCEANHIPYGVYKYTYADTVAKAVKEAQEVVDLLRSHGLTGTMVWWDVEDRNTLWKLGSEQLTACVRAAQQLIEASGFRFGIYIGLYVYNEKWFDFSQFANVPFWVARYPSSTVKTLDYTPAERYKPNISRALWGWQYSSKGRVPGISGDVDLNICYQNPAEDATITNPSSVIYTVSVADVWTRAQAEEVQKQLAAIGINGVVHKVQILE